MRNLDWKVECRNLALWMLLAGPIGWGLGILPWALLSVSFGYIAWTWYQLERINNWLHSDAQTQPPESGGLWGLVFDGIYQLQITSSKERDRLQKSIDYLQDSFASLDDAAVILSETGNITWCNEAAGRTLGLRFPEDSNQSLVNLIRLPEFIRYFEGNDYKEGLQVISPYNSEYKLLINITHFGKGSRLLFARDITETSRLQEMRKDFVANVSHELRTPLTVINGYLETLSDVQSVGVTKDELRWRRAIEQMLVQSRRMESLIKDLIALSRLESISEQSVQSLIDVSPMIERIREEALATVKGKRDIIIECDDSIQLQGNSDEIHSAFANLVLNAAKYTPENGTIWVRWYRRSPQQVCLTVEDNGDGIDSHHIPRLTERFYRVDKSRSIDTGGTGLGLAIVKHILFRHQAELSITSELGSGSNFTCVFPHSRSVTRSNIA